MTLRPDARRYECGTLNTVGCYGLKAAIELLLEIGTETISEALHGLADDIVAAAQAKGYEVLVPRTRHTGSGIVSYRHPTADCRPILDQLKAHWSTGLIPARMDPDVTELLHQSGRVGERAGTLASGVALYYRARNRFRLIHVQGHVDHFDFEAFRRQTGDGAWRRVCQVVYAVCATELFR